MSKSKRRFVASSGRGFGYDLVGVLLLVVVTLGGIVLPIAPARAEGSKDLFPTNLTCADTSTSNGCRFSIEWRPGNTYGPDSGSGASGNANDQAGSTIQRRTQFGVFAKAGEKVLLGSTAMGTDQASILVFPAVGTQEEVPGLAVAGDGKPDTLSGWWWTYGSQQDITGLTPALDCKADQPGTGQIASRSQELAGPRSVKGSGNTSGYTPCVFTVPDTGIYTVIMFGPAGANPAANDGTATSAIDFGTSPGDATAPSGDSTRRNTIAAWDITVRSGDPASTKNIDGRAFTFALAAFTGANERPLVSKLYPVTRDGYRYEVDFNGLDPNGFLIFGNDKGFLDPQGRPLNHDILSRPGASGLAAQLVNRTTGYTAFAGPYYPMFFTKDIDDEALDELGIPREAEAPTLGAVSFTGNRSASTGEVNNGSNMLRAGGVIRFAVTFPPHDATTKDLVPQDATYQVVISRGADFDPGNPQNRTLIDVTPHTLTNGTVTMEIPWDGKDNTNKPFPAGQYEIQVQLRSGVYHFPLIDAEASGKGGPSFTMLNPPDGDSTCGWGVKAGFKGHECSTAFYDDRGYTTVSNSGVVTNVGIPGGVLCPQNGTIDANGSYNKAADLTNPAKVITRAENADQTTVSPSEQSADYGVHPLSWFSDPILGYDSTTTQRAWGTASRGSFDTTAGSVNKNGNPCSYNGTTYSANSGGGFGDTKGLDTWTFFPSAKRSAVAVLVTRIEAPDDEIATSTDTPITVSAGDLLANDPGNPKSVVSVTDGSHGTAVLNPDGSVTYTPADGYFGDDEFTYTNSKGVTADVLVHVSPLKAVVKTVTVATTGGADDSYPVEGDLTGFTYEVSNRGDQPVTHVEAVSDLCYPSTLVPDATQVDPGATVVGGMLTLAPGATATYTCTSNRRHALTQDEIDAGLVTEGVTATGLSWDARGAGDEDDVYVSVSAPKSTKSAPLPFEVPTGALELKITKNELHDDGDGNAEVGETVTYEYTVTNHSNVTVRGVAVSSGLGMTAVCPAADLAPGDSMVCTATYTLTAGDIAAASVRETATASGAYSGWDPGGSKVVSDVPIGSEQDEVENPLVALGITVVVSGVLDATGGVSSTLPDAGDQVVYTYTVTNTSNVTLDDVAVPKQFGVDSTYACAVDGTQVTLPVSHLAVGKAVICTEAVTLTQGMIDDGSITADVTTTGSHLGTTVSAEDDDPVPFTVGPKLKVRITDSSVDQVSALPTATSIRVDAGDTIGYTYVVTNTGNTTLTHVAIHSSSVPSPVFGSSTGIGCASLADCTLLPGESVTITGTTPALTQAEVNADLFTETVDATADFGGSPITPDADDRDTLALHLASSTLDLAIASAVVVDANGSGYDDEGDYVLYTYAVTNTGAVDTMSVTVACKPTGCTPDTTTYADSQDIGVGVTRSFQARYSLTSADLDANRVVATGVQASGTGAGVGAVSSDLKDVVLPLTRFLPAIVDPGNERTVVVDGRQVVVPEFNLLGGDPEITVVAPPGSDVSFVVTCGGKVVASGGPDGVTEVTPGHYRASFDTPVGVSGVCTVTVSIDYDGDGTVDDTRDLLLYIDPAGTVVDDNGDPVEGAEVTLWESASPVSVDPVTGEPDCSTLRFPDDFAVVPSGSTVMSATNRTNPWITGKDGIFSWDVATGCYVVAANYVADGDTYAGRTDILPIPPERGDLRITLVGLNRAKASGTGGVLAETGAPGVLVSAGVGGLLLLVCGTLLVVGSRRTPVGRHRARD